MGCILLSLNGDFSDIVAYPPSQFGGIISIQLHNRPELLQALMLRLCRYLRDQSEREHYVGKLILAEAHRLRVRT
jgi:hypothetical protein